MGTSGDLQGPESAMEGQALSQFVLSSSWLGLLLRVQREARFNEHFPAVLLRCQAEGTPRQSVPWGDSQRGCHVVIFLVSRILTN